MRALDGLRVKIFADGADCATILELCANPLIKGFTTNPTMMRSAGVSDYQFFAQAVLAAVGDRPISFEVLSDEQDEMRRQARKITSWGDSVYVKIPITNTRREPTAPLVERLVGEGVKLNVTALMTLEQIAQARDALGKSVPGFISLFAGRIADTGVDPVPMVKQAVSLLADHPNLQLIWASPRELLNIFHADSAGSHVITLTADLLGKLPLLNKDLNEYSLDTVKMFFEDASRANLVL
jgi:transaldolase